MATTITGDSPQAVAMALLEKIAEAEHWGGSQPGSTSGTRWDKTRTEILDAYAECLNAVSDQRKATHFP